MLPGMELRAWPPLLTEVPIIDVQKVDVATVMSPIGL